MKPLIEIQTVPIAIEYKINPATTQRKEMMAEVEVSRNKGGLTIQSRPIQLNVDSFEARNSISPSPRRSVEQAAQLGKQAAYEATARFASEGNMLLNIHLNQDPLSQIAENRLAANDKQFTIGFSPDRPVEISWTPPEMSINYEMDKLNFDWKTNRADFEFIPGNIEFTIKNYPELIIKYVGDPIYVPPSSNPNYQPVDAKA